MRIEVLGCGEAFDETLPNTSLLVSTGDSRVLLDCGYNIPQRLWATLPDPNGLDVIYISHAHADHYFGVPAIITRMWEEKRTRPLTIVTQQDVSDNLHQLMELAYRGVYGRLPFALRFVDAKSGEVFRYQDVRFEFAPTVHAVSNLAVRLTAGGRYLCYSGDGESTDRSERLLNDVDLLFHEAFKFEQTPLHASIEDVVRLGGNVKRAALVHVQRAVRADADRIRTRIEGTNVVLPEPSEIFDIN